jgi:hypothetical protein
MSHFTVTVRITKKRLGAHGGDLDAALAEMMAPYDEDSDDPRFLEFNDQEDELRQEYENDSDEWVDLGPVNDVAQTGEIGATDDRVVSGTECIYRGRRLVRSWHEMFRVPGQFGIGGGSHHVPEHLQEIEIPYRDLYSTFEDFVANYHDHKARDTKTGRYGYWCNPNKKWDWYTIGGRWRGYFPVKPGISKVVGRPGAFGNEDAGGSDVVRLDQIDLDAAQRTETERFEEFKTAFRQLIDGKRDWPAFEGPRSRALDIGILRVEQDPSAVLRDGEVQVGSEWGEQHPRIRGTNRARWRDIALNLTDAEFERYRVAFNPLKSYAALDDQGWYEPGKMGWWGCAGHTPDTYLAYAEAFMQRVIKSAAPDDTLVLVDCHI